MAKASGGRRFSKTCLIKGREGEGRKAIIKMFPGHTRVAPIREDGFTDNGAEVVPTSVIIDVRPLGEAATSPGPHYGFVGERGNIVLPAALRRRHGLEAGSAFLIEEQAGAVIIRPAEVVPRQARRDLDSLLAGVTAENLHGEVSTGPAVGKEAW